MRIERASPGDLAMRARSARGRVPEHLGAVLVLDPPVPEPEELARVVAARLAAVPRLRQRVARVPPGAGGPIWADLPGVDPGRAVRVRRCPAPGDERALLDLAAELACAPLERDGPLWRATVVSGLATGGSAVVVVLDHLLADGIGGLAVLARLVDGAPAASPLAARPRPRYRALAADAARARLAALRRLPASWRAVGSALRAGRALRGGAAEPCSLLARTGPRRAFTVARADLAGVRAAAAAAGATVGDALLAAVAGALRDLLASRGESVDELRLAVMVAVGGTAGPGHPDNAVAPLVVGVPTAGTAAERLRRIAGGVRRHRAEVADPAVAGVAVPLLRLAAATGLYHRWIGRQRLFHASVSDVTGPAAPVSVAGARVAGVVPFSVGETGNVAVAFVCLSYAGVLTVTAVADRDGVPDLPVLGRALQAALDELGAAAPSAVSRPARVPGAPAPAPRGAD